MMLATALLIRCNFVVHAAVATARNFAALSELLLSTALLFHDSLLNVQASSCAAILPECVTFSSAAPHIAL